MDGVEVFLEEEKLNLSDSLDNCNRIVDFFSGGFDESQEEWMGT